MYDEFLKLSENVHYRIGSLETDCADRRTPPGVHYRIGSLEKTTFTFGFFTYVHYRIGSLEIQLLG